MPHSYGYRARTRQMFAKPFRKNGQINMGTYLKPFKVGDIVDVVGDGAFQKGMPHKFYHGKTGVIWNVTKRAVGVELNKLVGNRILAKRIHVRVEHVRSSKSRQGFLDRVKDNTARKAAAKAEGKQVSLRRQPEGPRPGQFVKTPTVETLYAVPYAGIAT